MFSDSFFARQQVTYLNGSMVVGFIIIWIEIFICFNQCWWYGVKLFWWCQLGFRIFALFPAFWKFTENIIGSFLIDPFLVFIIFDVLFLNFIVCIFGIVARYILIIGVSLPEMELFSLIEIECVLISFW